MLDISNICRICLKEEDPKLPIFTENDDKGESKPSLPEKIMSIARVKVVKDDGLPMYICVKCYCQVDTTVEFKRLCEESFHFFTQQLDSLSNQPSDSRGGYASYVNGSTPDTKDNPDSQFGMIPEDSIKTEEYDPEYGTEDGSTTQVFRITGSDESWIDNCETEIDPTVIKCEPSFDYPNFEFDLSNVKIENGTDGLFDEEGSNPLELSPEDVQNFTGPEYYDVFTPASGIEKSCKCRSCEMVFSSRREVAFHISLAHRRCGTCRKYFVSNKDRTEHKCGRSPSEEGSLTPSRKLHRHCPLCNKKVKRMRAHMARHRKQKVKVAEMPKEPETVYADDARPEALALEALRQDPEGVSEDKVKCCLCDVVCAGQKGFKIHLTLMHSDHRIVYTCFVCKSLQFFSKRTYKNHLTKHGVLANGDLQFDLKHVADCQLDSRSSVKRQMKKKKKNNFKGLKSDRKIKKLTIATADCLDGANGSFAKKKLSSSSSSPSPTLPVRAAAKREEARPKRSDLESPPSHPPFSSEMPVIPNNFDVIIDGNGVKRYVCRGCNVSYKFYMAAYNHYYSLSKRAAKVEQNPIVINSKPYNCKFCTLKFASRSQAMMHRIHAHKYFYKKFAIEKK